MTALRDEDQIGAIGLSSVTHDVLRHTLDTATQVALDALESRSNDIPVG